MGRRKNYRSVFGDPGNAYIEEAACDQAENNDKYINDRFYFKGASFPSGLTMFGNNNILVQGVSQIYEESSGS
jgi:hypothetical protein